MATEIGEKQKEADCDINGEGKQGDDYCWSTRYIIQHTVWANLAISRHLELRTENNHRAFLQNHFGVQEENGKKD